MRCIACDTLLMEEDLKRRDPHTKEPLDLCLKCYQHSQSAIHGFEIKDSFDLKQEFNLDQEVFKMEEI